MSRIGRLPVEIPNGVTVTVDENNNVLESFVTRGFGNSYESDEEEIESMLLKENRYIEMEKTSFCCSRMTFFSGPEGNRTPVRKPIP